MDLRRIRFALPIFTLAALAGCVHRAAAPVAPIVQVAPPAVAYAPLPPFAAPGMVIPAALPDGSYPTPSNGVSSAGAVWHLRAALNVAALSCPAGSGIVAAYNSLLTQRRAMLASAQQGLASEFRGQGDDAYDRAMTRMYNFYAQFPARPGFCAAATQVLAEIAAQGDDAVMQQAPSALAALDRPFTDFYRAYDAWRTHQTVAGATTTIALSAPAPVTPDAR